MSNLHKVENLSTHIAEISAQYNAYVYAYIENERSPIALSLANVNVIRHIT